MLGLSDATHFNATFDGNGKVIANLLVNRARNHSGLFAALQRGGARAGAAEHTGAERRLLDRRTSREQRRSGGGGLVDGRLERLEPCRRPGGLQRSERHDRGELLDGRGGMYRVGLRLFRATGCPTPPSPTARICSAYASSAKPWCWTPTRTAPGDGRRHRHGDGPRWPLRLAQFRRHRGVRPGRRPAPMAPRLDANPTRRDALAQTAPRFARAHLCSLGWASTGSWRVSRWSRSN